MDLKVEPTDESVPLLDQQQTTSAFHRREGVDKRDARRFPSRLDVGLNLRDSGLQARAEDCNAKSITKLVCGSGWLKL